MKKRILLISVIICIFLVGFSSAQVNILGGKKVINIEPPVVQTSSGGNSSWNQTFANTLYANIKWGYNQSESVAIPQYNEVAGWNFTDYIRFTQINQDGFNISFLNMSENLIMKSDVTGNNYFGISTDGAFLQLYANPNPSNDYLLFTVTETQGADTELNFYEGGTGHNRFWDSGSARFGGGASYLCSNLTTMVDCDTPLTGADIVVQDDGWFGGELFSTNLNVSGTSWFGGKITSAGGVHLQDNQQLGLGSGGQGIGDAVFTPNTTDLILAVGGGAGKVFNKFFVKRDTQFDNEVDGVPHVIVYSHDTATILDNSNLYLKSGVTQTNSTKCTVMQGSGSITGMTLNIDVTGSTGASNVLSFNVIKNGANVWSETISTSVGYNYEYNWSQARDTDTFVEGDCITEMVKHTRIFGSTNTVDEIIGTLEFYYD